MRTRTFARVGLAIVAAAVTVVLASGVGTAAATSDQQLFEMGSQALQQGNFVEAAMYLYAYLQRYPAAAAQNPAHANQVNEAIQTSRTQIRDREHAMQQEISDLRARLGGPGSSVSGLTVRPRLDPPSPPSEPSYPLACRGAGGMQVDLLAEGFGLTGTMFTMEFRRAASAGATSLGPGECAWLDRPVAVAEPNRICDLVETSRLHLEFATDGQVRGLVSRSAPYLSRLVAGNDVLTFRVFNNRQGCMVATSVPSAVLPFIPGRGRVGRGRL